MAREREIKLDEPQISQRNSLAKCSLWSPPPGLLSPFTAMIIHDHSVTVQRILARQMDESRLTSQKQTPRSREEDPFFGFTVEAYKSLV